MSGQSIALQARYVLPVSSPPIDAGTVVVEGSKIVAVGKDLAADRLDDLGDVAIVPGLVNAHTHLEFSSLSRPLGTPGMSLAAWLRVVIDQRRARTDDPAASVARGLAECLAGGTTAVGEIATFDWRSDRALSQVLPTTVMFHESIGPTPARAQQALASAEEFLAAPGVREDILPGLSPHSPYTVHPRLLSRLVALAERHRAPLAMHLAESREELELLRDGSGPMRELLEAAGSWDASSDARLPRALDYLAELARAPRALVIHANYLDDEETAFLAAHRRTMSVVYCPRTHHFFAHEPYPLVARLAAGVSVALGTDSRASNPDLSLFEEMRFVAAHHNGVDPATVLRLGTVCGATALGLEKRAGTIEIGKQADLTVIALGNVAAADPHELLFLPESRVVGGYFRGTPFGVGG